MYNHKIFYSEEPSIEQEILLITFMKTKGYYDLLEKNHMYVYLSEDPNEVYFKVYKSSRVNHISETYGLPQDEVMDYLFHSFTFYQEIREMLYWNSIGTYKKYVPCTGEIRTVNGTEAVIENECVFAKTEQEAELLFRDIGYSDLMYVVDIDE
jgi:hypothetical protein